MDKEPYEEHVKRLMNMTDEEALEILKDLQIVLPRKTCKNLIASSGYWAMLKAYAALKEKVEKPKIAYLCKFHQGPYECKHTTHIEDALNFEKVDSGMYMEKIPETMIRRVSNNDKEKEVKNEKTE